MRCSSRPLRLKEIRAGGRFAGAVAIVFGIILAAAPPPAQAQIAPRPPPTPPPTPLPTPSPSDINSNLSLGAAVTNLGSNFLERLGNEASYGFSRTLRNNPGGGGASETMDAPRFRTWGEAYGIWARTGAQGDFVGDRRQTWGGVGGLGARLAPGVNVGVSVDQSHTQIDVPLALQVATLDLTQIGANASVDKGPWTWAIALVHGFGNVNSSRDTGAGFARADYNAHIDGALTELSYYWSLDQSRIVPRSNMCAPPPHRFRSWAGLIPSRRAGQRWSVHGFCWVRRSVITGFSVKRFSICLATANSSTMSPRISVRSR